MSLTNMSKPSTSLTNSSKVFDYETWATIPTTFATETRTWIDCISLIDNSSKISSSIINQAKP